MRGEHGLVAQPARLDGGPSPRAWGALLRPRVLRRGQRTIPTCVGSTAGTSPTSSPRSDHPHVRGEHDPEQLRRRLMDGPSPRAWGARSDRESALPEPRTIPTCVGSTWWLGWLTACTTDHPHVRGEHRATSSARRNRIGPSPRAWGAQTEVGPPTDRLRTIPTCVGSTGRQSESRRRSADHPHVRGEHSTTPRPQVCTAGPSPRAWGAPVVVGHQRAARRTIPTCVGSTCW